MTPVTLETERLYLRPWKDADVEPFEALNADPRVCEFYPTEGFTRAESLAMIARIRDEMAQYGFGLWAVEVKESGAFIGYTGLKHLRAHHPLAPAVEVGWRLAHSAWGQGYASEAAREALRYGFDELVLPEIVSFTTPVNRRSLAVMQRIGMERAPERDFLHPDVPADHPLHPHVTYVAKNKNQE